MKKSDFEIVDYVLLKESYLKVLFLLVLSLFGGVLGGGLNMMAVSENGGRMPVFTSDWVFDDKTHFSFSRVGEVSLFWLTDIISVKGSIYSFGDVLIYASVVTTLTLSVLLVRVSWRLHRVDSLVRLEVKRWKIINR